jgi:hypothetical protein
MLTLGLVIMTIALHPTPPVAGFWLGLVIFFLGELWMSRKK